MQTYKNSTKDTRRFTEVWMSLTPNQKEEIQYRITAARCAKTRQTIWNWTTGRTTPSPIIQETLASILTKFLGNKYSRDTLFPIV